MNLLVTFLSINNKRNRKFSENDVKRERRDTCDEKDGEETRSKRKSPGANA